MAAEVHQLTRRFGDVVALDAVSFDVHDAELFGLVGPDGGGKTTLFRILTTLLLPDEGTATILGCDVVNDMWEIRSRVGYMPGTFSLYPDLSVAENLEFFAAVFGTTVEKGHELFAPIYRQLEPFRDRRAEALSGGMKQKLALSCALVHRPDILLLDEPSTGVDAVSRREFWDQLQVLKESGLTIIVSTPYMDEAMRCDRVALVHAGRILGIDAPASFGNQLRQPLFAVRGADRYGMLVALRAYAHTQSVYLFGDSLHFSDKAGQASLDTSVQEGVTRYLVEQGFVDVRVESITAGIEDSFIALMGTAA